MKYSIQCSKHYTSLYLVLTCTLPTIVSLRIDSGQFQKILRTMIIRPSFFDLLSYIFRDDIFQNNIDTRFETELRQVFCLHISHNTENCSASRNSESKKI